MNASRYADSSPAASAQSTTEQNSTAPTDEPITHTSDPQPATTSSFPYHDHNADPMDPKDEFSQTRVDDLFDDDFTPLPQPTPQPAPQRHVPTGPKDRENPSHRGPTQRGSRGRGGRRGGPSEEEQTPASGAQDEVGNVKEAPREHAVRGDRSGTGGVKKPKLTEDELSARLSQLKIKNAAREAAHKRAEADEASFQQREQVAQAKRQEERQNRQVLEGERERNRQRKLGAVQGREWDAEKKEDDYSSGRGGQSSQFRRGAYGGVAYASDGYDGRGGSGMGEGSEFPSPRGESFQRGSRGRGRGRGDGFGGRGGGRGRGGQYNGPSQEQPRGDGNTRNSDFLAATDFPALPSTSSGQDGTANTIPGPESAPQTENDQPDSTTTKETQKVSVPGVANNSERWNAKSDGVEADTWATDQSSGGKDATWADQMITPVTPS